MPQHIPANTAQEKKMYAYNNGWKYDVEFYSFRGSVWFRIWRDRFHDVAVYPQMTLGM